MDAKFMKIKKLIIPTITMLIMCSQIMGCASVSSKEMVEMLREGSTIEIEVAVPSYYEEEQGTESNLAWTELGSQSNYQEFRMGFDDLFKVMSFDQGKKNGPCYIDLEGNWTNNSTLHYAMQNKVFMDILKDSDTIKSLTEYVQSNYVDVDESDEKTIRDIAINAYFSLFDDNEVGYANKNSTLTRGEFLAGLVKSDTPVDAAIQSNSDLVALVGSDSEQVKLASQALDDSYLDVESKSLDKTTFNGTITRAEAIYTIVQRYFSEEYVQVTGKEKSYSDTANAQDIALRAGIKDKKTNEVPDRWKAGILSLMVNEPNKGMDDELYKAMVVSKQIGLIESKESNWDEALTKGEAIELIINANKAIAQRDGYAVDAEIGLNEGQAIDREGTSSIDASQGNGEYQDTKVNGDIVDGTALTQEEIDQLKANATTDTEREDIEAYESIIKTGEWIDPVYHGTYNEVVGKPGDTSWRQMTDEEAQAVLAEHPNNTVAKAELANGKWSMLIDGKVYFDPYKYLEDSEKALDAISDQLITYEDFEN